MQHSILKKTILFIAIILSATTNFAQSITLSQDARVSILTCGTGNESYSLFGHTAIRIADPKNYIDAVYNYGAFDFNTPNFALKFIKGDLQYFAVAHSFTDFMNEYNYEKRAVYEQELNINLALKQKLFTNLNSSLSSGESHYTYKFIDKNCTSMVVDIVNKTLKGNVIVKHGDTNLTYRSILYPYFDNHFYEKLGTSIIFGKKVDQQGSQIFLPFELLKSLKATKYQNNPLAKDSKTLLAFNETTPSSWWNNAYTYILFLLFIVLINHKKIAQVYLLLIALLGLFFVFAGFYSDHQELAYNYNILLLNPLLLFLLLFNYRDKMKWTYNLAIFNLICLVVYLALIINKAHLLIVLPLILTNGILLARIAFQNKKSTNSIL
ncbi:MULTISPECIES: lipoprotein N-acyltransferase Lnb domain-containing protein [unclassified Flavobacterium]|uniref:lipoprotein N-acyltransferase Lnb domain-containing protein n=1 Tax=unclassified Flavobacterium TaxID=196869 RepID=UPI003F93EF0D